MKTVVSRSLLVEYMFSYFIFIILLLGICREVDNTKLLLNLHAHTHNGVGVEKTVGKLIQFVPYPAG